MVDHSLVGTPGYQAPEFLRGGLPHPAVDIYALGILFWQLDAREVPFQVLNLFSNEIFTLELQKQQSFIL